MNKMFADSEISYTFAPQLRARANENENENDILVR